MASISSAGIVGRPSLWFSSSQFRGRERIILQIRKINKVGMSFRSCYCSSSSSSCVMDPYQTLGIKRGASVSEVKKAFRKLAKQYHPDVCKGKDCRVQFKEINAAYEVVMGDLRGDASGYARYGGSYYYNDEDEDEVEGRGTKNPHSHSHSDLDFQDEWIGWEVGNWIFYQQPQQDLHHTSTSYQHSAQVTTNSINDL